MPKSILIIEDKENHFKAIYRALSETYDCFPKVVGNDLSEWIKLKRLAEKYDSENPNGILELLRSYNGGNFDLFVVDVCLTEFGMTQRPFERIGGRIRKDVLLKEFPEVPAVFLTIYSARDVKEFMQPGDKYICKHEFGNTNILMVINRFLMPWVNEQLANE